MLTKDQQDTVRAAWEAWEEKRGMAGIMSPLDWMHVQMWVQAAPLRIILRGFEDCRGRVGPRTPMCYAGPAVIAAIKSWMRGQNQ